MLLFAGACGRSVRTLERTNTGGPDAGEGGAPTGSGGDGGAPLGGRGGAGGRPSDGGAGALASNGSGGTAADQSGGTGGNGATGGSGAAECLASVPGWALGCDPELNLTSTCSFEATCKEVGCGEPWSEFDASGCERRACQSSDDCAAGERCMAAPLVGEFSCRPSYFEGCSVSDCGTCTCEFDPNCFGTSYCLPASEHAPADDCPIPEHTYCSVYEHDAAMLENYLVPGGKGDTQVALRACQAKLGMLRVPCGDIVVDPGGSIEVAGAGGAEP
jgi:hypothetical protein